MDKTRKTPKKRAPPCKRTKATVAAFCAALAEAGGNVAYACKKAKIRSRQTVYVWRDEDKDFAAAWDAAKAIGIDALEDEATRRAFHGTLEPVFHNGKKVATIKRYSDTLTIFLLKGGKPGKYRDNAKIEHTGVLTLEQLVLKSLEPPAAEPSDASG